MPVIRRLTLRYHRSLRRLLVLTILLILYGSLYPWRFTPGATPLGPLETVYSAPLIYPGPTWLRDLVLNVLLYIPVGLFAAGAMRRRSVPARVLLPLLLGFGLSLCIEVAQVYDATRYPSILDVITNTAGTGIGVIVALVASGPMAHAIEWTATYMDRDRSGSAVLLLWCVDRLFPLFPQIGLYTLNRKLTTFFGAVGSAAEFGRAFVLVLTLGVVLDLLNRTYSRQLLGFSLLFIPLQLFIWNRQPVVADLLGSIAGILIFLLLKPGRDRSTAAAVCCLLYVILSGSAPFHFQSQRNGFSFTFLEATFTSERLDALRILIGKSLVYGSCIWLLSRSGMRLFAAGGTTAALLVVIEVAQVWLPGRTPEVTDPVLALGLALLFAVLDRETGTASSKPLPA